MFEKIFNFLMGYGKPSKALDSALKFTVPTESVGAKPTVQSLWNSEYVSPAVNLHNQEALVKSRKVLAQRKKVSKGDLYPARFR